MTARARTNAPLDRDTQKRLAYLRRSTGLTTSDVTRAAINHYYEFLRARGEHAKGILESTGFVAGGDGPQDLSSNHKAYAAVTLGRKLAR